MIVYTWDGLELAKESGLKFGVIYRWIDDGAINYDQEEGFDRIYEVSKSKHSAYVMFDDGLTLNKNDFENSDSEVAIFSEEEKLETVKLGFKF